MNDHAISVLPRAHEAHTPSLQRPCLACVLRERYPGGPLAAAIQVHDWPAHALLQRQQGTILRLHAVCSGLGALQRLSENGLERTIRLVEPGDVTGLEGLVGLPAQSNAITLLLALTLTPLGWIQWRQVRMLDEVSSNQVDSIMWQAYQLERELGHLEQMVLAVDQPSSSIAPEDLQERYEIFLSRINLLRDIPRRDLLEAWGGFEPTLQQVERFKQLADPMFSDPALLLNDKAALSRLHAAADAIAPSLSELTREANRAVARFVDERNAQLRHQGLLVIGLAAAQIAVMLIFVGLLILGPRVFKLIWDVRAPGLLAFATASSEAAYPRLLEQLERHGVRYPL